VRESGSRRNAFQKMENQDPVFTRPGIRLQVTCISATVAAVAAATAVAVAVVAKFAFIRVKRTFIRTRLGLLASRQAKGRALLGNRGGWASELGGTALES
jgi:hypothetical protein